MGKIILRLFPFRLMKRIPEMLTKSHDFQDYVTRCRTLKHRVLHWCFSVRQRVTKYWKSRYFIQHFRNVICQSAEKPQKYNFTDSQNMFIIISHCRTPFPLILSHQVKHDVTRCHTLKHGVAPNFWYDFWNNKDQNRKTKSLEFRSVHYSEQPGIRFRSALQPLVSGTRPPSMVCSTFVDLWQDAAWWSGVGVSDEIKNLNMVRF